MPDEFERVYIRFKGRVLGPITQEKMLDLIRRGQITRQHELSPDGIAWKSAEAYPHLFRNETSLAKTKVQDVKSDAAVPEPNVQQWYASIDGQNHGPIDEATLKRFVEDGKVTSDTLIWRSGMQDWIEAETIRSEWFARDSQSVKTKSVKSKSVGSNARNGESGESTLDGSELTGLLASRGWVQFLSILGLIVGTVAVIGSVAWFFLIASQDGSGPVKVVALVVAIVAMASAFAWFVGCMFLLNYSNGLSVLKYRTDVLDVQVAINALNRFWKFTGIVVLIWLIVTSVLASMIYLLGLSVPVPN
jgi:hypothetical protein